MSTKVKNPSVEIEVSDDPWECGTLGREEDFAIVATVEDAKIDKALDLVQISIRLQRPLIEDFKYIAELNGLGYQTLMRQILTRFAESEKKNLLKEAALAQRELMKKEKESQAEEPRGTRKRA